ncbi:DUF6531 domain-containing protein [Subtercola sp. RTI3]|uniref:golvesin C-terminal-like domain-containing protein n=1 Tax=Subtercola sp. RTI3 TaxID=3048639 RepID=UPI002B23BAB8|nr:DUF6531 domain-containing protein [Subtercola sp. RTI3]MEA9987226.1 DUF6531 domain-containing protein [Subtercola sp. RTI3]
MASGLRLFSGGALFSAVLLATTLISPAQFANASPDTSLTSSSSAPTPTDFSAQGATSADIAVDGIGSTDGYHVRVARESAGFVWSDIAVIDPSGVDESTWYGYQCMTADGKYAAVAILPGGAINSNTARDRGAYAYGVDLTSGTVTALATGVGLKYHSPQCGTDDTAVFTSALGTASPETEILRTDLSTGKQVSQTVMKGQLTSAAPVGSAVLAASGEQLVTAVDGGTADKPVDATNAVALPGSPYDIRPSADGGVDFLSTEPDGQTSDVWHEKTGPATKIATGPTTGLALDLGRGGKNLVLDAQNLPASSPLTAVSVTALPAGVGVVSLDAHAAFGPDKAAPIADSAAAPDVNTDAPQNGQALVESLSTHQVFEASQTPVASGADSSSSAGSTQSTGTVLPGAATSSNGDVPQIAPKETGTRSSFTSTGPATLSIQTASYTQTSGTTSTGSIAPALSPGATTPKCSVARLQPTLEAMQPSNGQVDWASQMAEQGLLTGTSSTRPANFANMGLASYSPSSDFPPIALSHPATSTWTTVPRSVMTAIAAQESNFNQASWHAVPGQAGDPLIADYYGSGDNIDAIDYPNADCGYGVAQVTSGMAATDTSISVHGQMKVAVDYQENLAAGLNILEQTWNDLYTSGITVNGGDPKFLENWYFAAWAYNTGIQPTAAFGNTTNCTPSATCTGPDGTWGLGWSNNPKNPDYDPARAPYLQNTYADAAHPSSWPYQERIMGWMGAPIVRYGFTAYDTPSYNGTNTWLQIPAFNTFCTSANLCDTTHVVAGNPSANYCTLADDECWWHTAVTTVATCSTTCATSAYEDAAGSTEPAYTSQYQPTCNLDTTKVPTTSSGAPIIVDDLATPSQNRQGCSGMNWSNNGTFTYTPGTNSSGDPVGNIDTHQLGSGLGGHIFFTHTEPASATTLINTGTWTPNLPSLQYYKIKLHLPVSGATATDVVYTINPGGGVAPWKIRVNQDWESEQWVTIGTFAMQNGGNISLSNVSGLPAQEYDVAFDAVAFLPQGGTPGTPIGGPPTIQDAPKGSNPAFINCGCVTRTAGDPVDTQSGYYGETDTDLSTPGLGEGLAVTRSYSSSLADPAGPSGSTGYVNGAFGYGWTYNYGMTATTNATSGNVTIKQEDGSAVTFTPVSGGGYATTAPRFDATLTKTGTTYAFTRHAQDQFVFDPTTGRLTSESDLAGRTATPTYSTALAYDASGNLSTVTDPAGRVYTFLWSGTHIVRVGTSGGQEVNYNYDASGNLVTAFGVGTTRTGSTLDNADRTNYAYTTAHLLNAERSAANYGKTGTPNPVMSMTYDASERVTQQATATGDVTTFKYGPISSPALVAGQTLVTDGASHQTLYTYQGGLLTSMTKPQSTDRLRLGGVF